MFLRSLKISIQYCSWCLLVLAISSCATFDSRGGRSDYESYVWSSLHERSQMSEGRNLVNARWLILDSEYFAKREAALGFADPLTISAKEGNKTFLIVALQMKPNSTFTKSDFKVFWNDQELSISQEIVSILEMRSLYPFAYPFHRVFLFELPAGVGGANLSIRTPWGNLVDQQEQK